MAYLIFPFVFFLFLEFLLASSGAVGDFNVNSKRNVAKMGFKHVIFLVFIFTYTISVHIFDRRLKNPYCGIRSFTTDRSSWSV